MDSKRLKELAGVNIETEQEKILKEAQAGTKGLEEGGFGFGPAGHGGTKTSEQDVMSRLVHVLRDAKVYLRDGNVKDAALMVDRALSAVSKATQG